MMTVPRKDMNDGIVWNTNSSRMTAKKICVSGADGLGYLEVHGEASAAGLLVLEAEGEEGLCAEAEHANEHDEAVAVHVLGPFEVLRRHEHRADVSIVGGMAYRPEAMVHTIEK